MESVDEQDSNQELAKDDVCIHDMFMAEVIVVHMVICGENRGVVRVANKKRILRRSRKRRRRSTSSSNS